MINIIFIATTACSTYFGMAILAFLVACRLDPHQPANDYKLFAALWPLYLPALLFLKAWETILGAWSSIFDKILEEHQEREADRIRERADAALEKFQEEKETEPATIYRVQVGTYGKKPVETGTLKVPPPYIVAEAVGKECLATNEGREIMATSCREEAEK